MRADKDTEAGVPGGTQRVQCLDRVSGRQNCSPLRLDSPSDFLDRLSKYPDILSGCEHCL